MVSDLPNPLTYTYTAPNSGSCTFSGDYKFGEDSIKNMPSSSITVSSSSGDCSAGQTQCEGTTYNTCSGGNWISQGQVDGKCGYSSGNSGTDCSSGQTKCVSTNYYTCSNGYFISQGEVDSYCGYSSGGSDSGQNLDSILNWLELNWMLVVGGLVGLIILKSLLSK